MPGSRWFSTGHVRTGVAGRLVAIGREVVGPALGSFVALLAAGSILAIAGRLLDPTLGAGSPRSAAAAIVILGLACLGAPVHLGNLTVRGLPLGGLALFATALVWSVHRLSRSGSYPEPPAREPRGGPWIAVPLAALAAMSAWGFRLGGPTPVSVDAPGAAALAALWGALFGGFGRLTARRGRRRSLPGDRRWWYPSDALRQGVRTGAAMLLLTFAGAAVGLSLWLLARVFGAVTGASGPAAALGTVLLAVIFLPNLLSGAVALSLGASITTGAQLALGGIARQSTTSLSLLDGGGPWYLAVLLAVPPLACFVSGAAAGRHLGEGRAGPVLAWAAVTYSACLTGLAALSGVTLAGPTGGEAAVGAEVAETAALALAWAGLLGSAGWLRGNVWEPPAGVDVEGSRGP